MTRIGWILPASAALLCFLVLVLFVGVVRYRANARYIEEDLGGQLQLDRTELCALKAKVGDAPSNIGCVELARQQVAEIIARAKSK